MYNEFVSVYLTYMRIYAFLFKLSTPFLSCSDFNTDYEPSSGKCHTD